MADLDPATAWPFPSKFKLCDDCDCPHDCEKWGCYYEQEVFDRELDDSMTEDERLDDPRHGQAEFINRDRSGY